jgi:shikimate dehydrogenase
MRQFALVGRNLLHTFSPAFFEQKFVKEGISDAQYHAVSLSEINEISDFIGQTHHLKGFNVTIPYKEAIVPYLDNLHGAALETKVVNTVKVVIDDSGNTKQPGFRLEGYNTDAAGFSAEVRPLLRPGMDRALILGDGASAKTVASVLNLIGLDCLMVSRKSTQNSVAWEQLNDYIIKHHLLIVNTTPIGQFPNVDDCPALPWEAVGSEHLFFDLIYNPSETKFLQQARLSNARTQNGMGMLRLQAEKSWEIWNQD